MRRIVPSRPRRSFHRERHVHPGEREELEDATRKGEVSRVKQCTSALPEELFRPTSPTLQGRSPLRIQNRGTLQRSPNQILGGAIYPLEGRSRFALSRAQVVIDGRMSAHRGQSHHCRFHLDVLGEWTYPPHLECLPSEAKVESSFSKAHSISSFCARCGGDPHTVMRSPKRSSVVRMTYCWSSKVRSIQRFTG